MNLSRFTTKLDSSYSTVRRDPREAIFVLPACVPAFNEKSLSCLESRGEARLCLAKGTDALGVKSLKNCDLACSGFRALGVYGGWVDFGESGFVWWWQLENCMV